MWLFSNRGSTPVGKIKGLRGHNPGSLNSNWNLPERKFELILPAGAQPMVPVQVGSREHIKAVSSLSVDEESDKDQR